MTCYLNGEFLPLEEARIPVLDRGFIFGDGVYEAIAVYGRQPFRLAGHLARLSRSLAAVGITDPRSPAEWTELIGTLIARQPFEDQSVYLQVTRGVAKRDHAFPKNTPPTVFMMSNPLSLPSAVQVSEGVVAVTATDNRWYRCDVKSISLLANVLIRQFAVESGAAETVLLRNGFLTEGSASNIFVVTRGTVATPAKSHLILAGITWDAVADHARELGLPFEARDVPERELRRADEIWLASTTREVLAITTLDGKPVGDGRPGPLFQRVYAQFQARKQSPASAAA